MSELQGISYEAVIADLEAKKDTIDKAIVNLRQLISLGILGTQGAGAFVSTEYEGAAIPDDFFFGMGLADAAKKYLSAVRNFWIHHNLRSLGKNIHGWFEFSSERGIGFAQFFTERWLAGLSMSPIDPKIGSTTGFCVVALSHTDDFLVFNQLRETVVEPLLVRVGHESHLIADLHSSQNGDCGDGIGVDWDVREDHLMASDDFWGAVPLHSDLHENVHISVYTLVRL